MARLRLHSPSIASTASRRDSARIEPKSPRSRLRELSSPANDQENSLPPTPKFTTNTASETTPRTNLTPRPAQRRGLVERDTSGRLQDDLEIDNDETDLPQPSIAPTSSGAMEEDAYDPHQPLEVRQRLRKAMRDLNLDVADNASEWLKPGNDGLMKAILKSNRLFKDVKQTSDATIDARFLVSAGDLAHKRANNLVTGENAQGIDVDEFVGKCISFMKGPDTTRSRRDDADSDEEEDGDALDWRKLGMEACFIHNSRPALPGFLLGPLSVQKRVRAPTQRRARQQAQTQNVRETRPEEMDNSKLGENNDSTLTAMCEKLHNVIKGTLEQARDCIERWEEEEVPQEEIAARLAENCIATNAELWLFHLVINPASFGQTIENLFYLSFLIRDGLVGLDFDEDGMPTISDQQETDEEELRRKADKSRYQGILSLDYDTWEELIDIFDLKNQEYLLIPDRSEEEREQRRGITAGWY